MSVELIANVDRIWNERRRPIMVGISGGSGAGKSTLAHALSRALDGRAVVVEQDAYYRCRGHLPLEERSRVNFDHPDAVELELLAEHLGALKQGRAVEKPFYDFATHSRLDKTVPVKPAPVVIAEGLFLFVREDLRNIFDLRVFVDADADIRLDRRIKRDVTERGRTVESVLEQYFESVRPMHEEFVAGSSRWAHYCVTTYGENCMDLILQAFTNLNSCRLELELPL